MKTRWIVLLCVVCFAGSCEHRHGHGSKADLQRQAKSHLRLSTSEILACIKASGTDLMPIRDERGLRQIDNLVADGIVRFPENGKKEFGFPSTFPDAAAHVVSGFYRPDHRRHGIKYVVAWKHEEREPWNVTSAVATFDHEVFEMCESVQDDRWIREHIIEFPAEGSKTWLRLQECKNR